MDTLAHMWVDYDQEADIFVLNVRLRSDIQDARTDEAGHWSARLTVILRQGKC